MDERQQLETSIAALDGQRALLGDAVVDTAIGPLRERLEALRRQATPAAQRLRQISVLFCDIVGSTALTQRFDAEDVQAIIGGALQRFEKTIAAHGTRVLRFMGDGLFAAFGIDGAREDDPEQAVRAGLALLDDCAQYAAELKRDHGLAQFDIRVGVHTGSALLGGGVEADNNVAGMTVHLAARMEQTAPRGTLRISHDTWRHVRGLFDATAQPPLQVKGHDEPLLTYLVQRARPRSLRIANRGVVGVATPLIGRERELASLCDAFTALQCAPQSGLTAITLVGDAGLGKTRLLSEFGAWASAQPGGARWCEARASERRQGHPYGLLRDLFTWRLNIPDSDPAAVATERWLAQVSAVLGNEADAAVLGHLLGFDCAGHPAVRDIVGDARQLRDRAFHYATRYFLLAATAAPPLLLLLDDLHWADDGSLDFVEQLQTAAADAPLMLIGLTRSTLFERRPAWGTGSAARLRIDLPQLGTDHSDELADALLQRLPDVPPALRALVTEGAEGNPFYMEERVNMLIDQGAIVAGADDWQLRPERLAITRVPATLTGVLQARLDALDAEVRRTLQLAAVIGPVFWDQALAALGGDADAALATLMARELIVPREHSSLEGLREFAFRHHTLHQVSYESVLKRVRHPAHATVAAWLARQPGTLHLGVVAEHYERSGDAPQAIGYWHRAADAAMARYANAAALAQAERALALLPGDDHARRYELVGLTVRALERLADQGGRALRLDELQHLAEVLGDNTRRSEAAHRRAQFLYDGGEPAEALKAALQALAYSEDVAPVWAARANTLAASSLQRLGRYAEAHQYGTTGIRLARDAGDKVSEAVALNEMGMAANDQGDTGAAMPFFEQAVALHRETQNRSNEAGTLANMAYARFILGDYAAAEQQFMEALRLCREIGSRQSEGVIEINLALVHMNQGRAQTARDHAEAALDIVGATGDRWAEAAALRAAGQAELELGQTAAAAASFKRSRDLFDQLGLGHLAIEAIAGLALAESETTAALGHVEDILARLFAGASLAGTDEPMRVHLSCHRVLAESGDPRADTVLAAAVTELQARAAKLSDPAQRDAFLHQVPSHRELLAAINTSTHSCC